MLTRQAWPAACVGVGAAVLPGGSLVSDPPRMHELAPCSDTCACVLYISSPLPYPTHHVRE